VISEDYNIKLKVIDAKRNDSGVYTLTAKNINGTDSATLTITVLGKESASGRLHYDHKVWLGSLI